jgi:hypothetical protein
VRSSPPPQPELSWELIQATDGTGDDHSEVGTSDCAVLEGDKQISSMQATCDSLCGMGENDFCLSTFDNDECSHNSFSNYKAFSFNALEEKGKSNICQ